MATNALNSSTTIINNNNNNNIINKQEEKVELINNFDSENDIITTEQSFTSPKEVKPSKGQKARKAIGNSIGFVAAKIKNGGKTVVNGAKVAGSAIKSAGQSTVAYFDDAQTQMETQGKIKGAVSGLLNKLVFALVTKKSAFTGVEGPKVSSKAGTVKKVAAFGAQVVVSGLRNADKIAAVFSQKTFTLLNSILGFLPGDTGKAISAAIASIVRAVVFIAIVAIEFAAAAFAAALAAAAAITLFALAAVTVIILLALSLTPIANIVMAIAIIVLAIKINKLQKQVDDATGTNEKQSKKPSFFEKMSNTISNKLNNAVVDFDSTEPVEVELNSFSKENTL